MPAAEPFDPKHSSNTVPFMVTSILLLCQDYLNLIWQFMPVIPVLGRLWQENHEFETSLGYTGGPCFKKKKKH
jgi:hypothetical protein